MTAIRCTVACMIVVIFYDVSSSRITFSRLLRRQSVANNYQTLSAISATSSDDDGNSQSTLSLRRSNLLMKEYSSKGNSAQAEEIFRLMSIDAVVADQETYELLLQSWILSNCSLEKRVREAESVLHRLLSEGFLPSARFTVSLINLVGEINEPEKAEQIFDRISFAGGEGDIAVYNSLMTAWGRSTADNAALKAEELLERIEFAGFAPNVASYEALLAAWASSNRKDAAGKCVDVLKRMITSRIPPTIVAYEKSFTALAKSSLADAPEIGMELLSSMKSTESKAPLRASVSCYESLINIWLNSGNIDAAHAIGRIVIVMEILFPTLDLSNAHAANVIALCNSVNKKSKFIDITRADEEVVGMMAKHMDVPPSLHALLVNTWCKIGDPQKAEIALDRLSNVILSNMGYPLSPGRGPKTALANKIEASLQSASKITALPWNQVIAAYGVLKNPDATDDQSKGKDRVSDRDEEDDVVGAGELSSTSTSVRAPLSERDLEDTLALRARNADRVYLKLLHLSAQINRERREQTIGAYSALIGVRPDRWTYSALISIWASCGRLDKAEEKMTSMVRSGIRPTTVTYAALLRGWLARYTAASLAVLSSSPSPSSSSSALLSLDPVGDASGFHSGDTAGRIDSDRQGTHVEVSEDVTVADTESTSPSSSKILMETAVLRVKKYFSFLCRVTRKFDERQENEEAVGFMLGLEDGDGAFYCQDAFNRIVDAGIPPTLEMYKEVLRMLSSEKYGSTDPSNKKIPLGFEFNSMTSTADRAVTLFQHLVSVGGYHPDLECYELLVRAFELSSLNLKSRSTRLAQSYPSRALEVAEHMLSTGITPSRSMYESLLRMWVVSRRPDSPRIAESIFRSMVACTYSATAVARQPITGDDKDLLNAEKPSTISFLLLLEAWARSPLPNAAIKADEVVQTMVAAGVQPDQRAFSLMAYAWSKSWRWESNSGPSIFTRTPSPSSSSSSAPSMDREDRESLPLSVSPAATLAVGIEGPLSGMALSAMPEESDSIDMDESVIFRESADKQQQQQIGFRRKGEFVNQTEEILHRCLAAGLAPDMSLRRSLLFVWCKDRQSRSTLLASEKGRDGSGEPLSVHVKKSSIQKAEDLLARISLITAARSLGAEESKRQLKRLSLESEDDLASKTVAWDTEESVEALLPHPSVYMQLAAAWKEVGYALDQGEYPAVQRAESFLRRVKEDINKLLASSDVTASDGDSVGTGAQLLLGGDDSHAATARAKAKVHRSAVMKSNCLYIAYNLLLAAHALTSTGTMQCSVAEDIFRSMAAPSSSSSADAHPLHAAAASIPSTIYPSPSTSSQSSSSSSSSSSTSSHTTAFDKGHVDFSHPVADVVSANLLVECIRLSGCEDIVKKCEALWYPSSSSNSDSISNSNSYFHASQSVSTDVEQRSGSSGADSGPQGIGPNDYTFELMSKIWQENKCNDIASRTQTLFDRLRLQAEATGGARQPYFLGVPALSPSVASYSTLVDVWTDLDPLRATEIVDRMTGFGLAPAYQVYSRLMKAWADKGRRDKCDSVLMRMLSAGYKPDPISCRLLLSVHASTDLADSAERTEEALQRLLQAGVRMDEHLLISQLQAWSKSRSPIAANKAETALAKGLASGVPPSAALFNVLLDTHGKSKQPDSPLRAEGVLRRMKEAGITPEICSYNAAVAAWGRSLHKDAEERSALVFEQAVRDGAKPNVITYSSLLSALSRSRDKNAPFRADTVFEKMLEAGVQPDTMAWTILITIWSRSKLAEKENKVQDIFMRMLAAQAQPSEVTYTALLSMWGKSRHPQASQRIVEVFQHMRSAGRTLDTVGYSSLLSALSRSQDKNAPYRANEVFEQMLGAGIRADPMAWTILITLWSKSALPNKEAKVQQIFKKMLASGEQPNAVTYTSLLIMWTRSRLPVAKERILAIYDRIWNEYVRLDGLAFEVLIGSLRRACTRVETLRKTDALMGRLADFEMPPDARAWSCVIAADNSSGAGSQCHVRALRLYRRMTQSGVRPTIEVFEAVVSAIERSGDISSPAIRDAIVAQMAVYGLRMDQLRTSSLKQ